MEAFTPRPLTTHAYGRIMRFWDKLLSFLGLTIRLHGDKQLLKDGDIFLFNHFARLETLLPPYLMFKETGQMSYSVAHKSLFKIHPRLNRFFADTGTLPTDLPGLMPYLAAEILKGRKMMIYPEGGMIRNRKVRQDNGEFAIYTDKTGELRKLHRGAAALAQMLNLFKARLLQLEKRGDTARLGRWQIALQFDDVESLLRAARKPTVLVPATFTFYPIRNAPNVLSFLARRFVKKLSPALEDELVTEGNLLLRATDLDIQLNDPIILNSKMSKMESWLLDQTFTTKVTSLEELFAMRDKAEGWSEKLLANALQARTDDLRDQYIPRLYAGLHLNLGHLFATLLLMRHAAGDTKVDLPTLRSALYRAAHALQQVAPKQGLHLHSTLTDPTRYASLRSCCIPNRHLQRLLDISTQSELLVVKGVKVMFRPAMAEAPDAKVARLEHPLHVMANEAEVVDGLKDLLKQAWADASAEKTIPLEWRWQDELNGFAVDREGVEDSTLLPATNGAPYRLLPKKPHAIGVMLIHGFLSSPGQLRHVGESLAAAGHPVLGARIPGHGTHVQGLHDTPPATWLSSILRQYELLAESCEKVVVLGFSTGGMLALRLAAQRPEKLAGVITVAAPYQINERFINLVPYAHLLNRLLAPFTKGRGIYPTINYPTNLPELGYGKAPVPATNGLLRHIKLMHRELANINVPTLILHADADPLCDPNSAVTIANGLTRAEKTLLFIRAPQHNIISHPTAEVLALVQGFIRAAADKKGRK